MSGIEIKRLRKVYGEKVVLNGLDLTLAPGGRYALMAPSGGVKTTLLRLLAGLEVPDGGAILGLEGLRVAMQFQEDRLLEYAGALANLRFVLPRGTDEGAARALLVALLPGADLNQPVGAFSGGMKRRVALARALAVPAELLLLDEPFTGLDGEAKRIAARCISNALAAHPPTTLLLTTHDEEEAEMCKCEILRLP